MLDLIGSTAILGQSYSNSLSGFQWGITAVGVGLIVMGAGLAFAKPKPSGKPTSPAVKWIGVSLPVLLGVGTIIYAWVGF